MKKIPFLNEILFSFGFIAICIASSNWAKYNNSLQINNIYFHGNEFLTNKRLKNILNSIEMDNIHLINLTEISKLLEKDFFIEAVRASKHFPNKLEIEIIEREPIAVINIDEPLLIDRNGIILPKNEIANKKLIPFLSGFNQNKNFYNLGKKTTSKKMQEAIALLKELKIEYPKLYNNLSELTLNNSNEFVMILLDYPTKVNLGSKKINNKLEIIQNFESMLKEENLSTFASIDLRYKNQIITQGK